MTWRLALAVVLGAVVLPGRLMAHEGEPLRPHDLAGAWVLDPMIALPLALTALLYAVGLRALWTRSAGRGIRRWEAAAFIAGWLVLALALISPLHPLGEVLFSAHMTQHVLLMGFAAPLLVLGRPSIPMLWALPIGWRRTLGAWTRMGIVGATWRGLTHPVVAWILHAAAILVWHIPVLYDASVAGDGVHALQHASFLGTALLFWWSLLHGRERRVGFGAGIISLFTIMVVSGGLGALMTFARRPWYTAYAEATLAWGLTPLEDQQLAGLIMWVPAGVTYLLAALLMLAAWLREAERRAEQWERRAASVARQAAGLSIVLVLLAACGTRSDRYSAAEAGMLTGGDADRGREHIRRYGCSACHTVSGVPGANGEVGPPLDGVGRRMFLAGRLTNDPSNLVRWIRDPKSVDSLTAMPVLGVTEEDARDIAAYLYTTR